MTIWFASFLNPWCLTDSPRCFDEFELSVDVSKMQLKDLDQDWRKGMCVHVRMKGKTENEEVKFEMKA